MVDKETKSCTFWKIHIYIVLFLVNPTHAKSPCYRGSSDESFFAWQSYKTFLEVRAERRVRQKGLHTRGKERLKLSRVFELIVLCSAQTLEI